MKSESAHAKDKRVRFEQELLECHGSVYRTVLNWTHDKEETENIVQEAELRCLNYMQQRHWVPEIQNATAFVIRTAQNLRNDLWKHRIREESIDDETARQPNESKAGALEYYSDIEKRIYLEELFRILPLRTILSGLSDYECRILYSHAAEGMSHKEIAKDESVTVELLRYQLQKVYAKIRYRARRYLKETGTKSLFDLET